MGGKGSGRLPSTETLIKRSEPEITPIADGVFIPNLSGVKPEAKKTSGADITSFTGTTGSVPFIGSDGGLTEDNLNLFWDDANNRLGIGTSSPDFSLHIVSDVNQLALFESTDDEGYIRIRDNDTTIEIKAQNQKMLFSVDTASNMVTFKNDGNVGINTTTPDTKLQVVGDLKVGDDNTNYLEVSTTGDLTFVGTAGLPFAEIYARDNTATTSTSTTKAQILIFDTNGEFNNMTPDHAQDHITVVKAGKYKIDASISIKNSSGAAHVISLEMYKNNGTGVFNNIHAGRTLGTGSDVGNLTMSGIVDLAANDTIEMWITSDSGAARTVTVEDIDLCAIQIGGT